MTVIKTMALTKSYKNCIAVDNLDLEINCNEIFALLGVNGAGKTTTVKMLTGLTKPTGGDALIFDKSILKNSDEIKRLIGVSPQETAIAPNLTVLENLELLCGIYGVSKEKVNTLLEEFSLNQASDKKASKLSGGWQRRLSIALALIGDPKILFLDEPTLGLDVIARSELWDTIRSLKSKATIVLTTHYMEEAEALCDRVGIMKDGKMLIIGTPEAIKGATGKEKFEEAFISVVKGKF